MNGAPPIHPRRFPSSLSDGSGGASPRPVSKVSGATAPPGFDRAEKVSSQRRETFELYRFVNTRTASRNARQFAAPDRSTAPAVQTHSVENTGTGAKAARECFALAIA